MDETVNYRRRPKHGTKRRRTKEEIEFNNNNNLLKELFRKHANRKQATVLIGKLELVDSGYKGSLLYCTPTCYKNFWIRQLLRSQTSGIVYSILKVSCEELNGKS
jgi:hypothetical protein